MPSTVAQMASAARLEKEMSTLVIGPATGINLALISRLVGPEHAVGVEIDETLAATCRTALAATGYGDATVVAGDGEQGYAPPAPYWRVLSTAAARRIPYAWVQQTRQGGLIVSPFQTTLCPQGAVVLTVHGNTASSHFTLPLRFMLLRGQRTRAPFETLFTDQAWEEARTRRTNSDATFLTDWDARFTLGLHLPGVHQGRLGDGNWLSSNDSWAYLDDDHVHQWGPRELFDEAATTNQL